MSSTGQLVSLAVVFMLMTFVVFALYALVTATARRVLSGPVVMRQIQRSFAVIFAGLAIDLALSER